LIDNNDAEGGPKPGVKQDSLGGRPIQRKNPWARWSLPPVLFFHRVQFDAARAEMPECRDAPFFDFWFTS